MSNNAQWWVDFKVVHPNGREDTMCLSLASPDLADLRQAHERARETATKRMKKKVQRMYMHPETMTLVCLRSRCVG